MSLLKRIEKGQDNTNKGSNGGSSYSARLQNRRVVNPTINAQRDTYLSMKARVQNRLLAELDPNMDINQTSEVRETIFELF